LYRDWVQQTSAIDSNQEVEDAIMQDDAWMHIGREREAEA
jgi:hypothetical protein